MNQKEILKEFMTIPGVGKSIAMDLWNLGYRSISELRNENPQLMYDKFCSMVGQKVDRCLLYVFRGAVYFAGDKKHDPELLKWWNWKDREL
jgi:hypothetical protein